MKIKYTQTCTTCTFKNHEDCIKLVSESNCVQDYYVCNNWCISTEYFQYILSNGEWYIISKFNEYLISFTEMIKLIESDYNGEDISVNLYDAIMVIFGLDLYELSQILGVSIGVVSRAKTSGTPAKRIKDFSAILEIPERLFLRCTNKDLKELVECNDLFIAKRNEF